MSYSDCVGGCGRMVDNGGEVPQLACGECQDKYPDALLKACSDEFIYALGLTDGRTVLFQYAHITGEWVHLDPPAAYEREWESAWATMPCPRGVDVRINHILWVADAPFGS